MTDAGFFLVLEGVEGAGKTTQARLLGERLAAAGVRHRVVREPGGTVAGERAREIVLDPELELSAEMELLLVLAARAEFVRKIVRPALAAGEVVVADRYDLSTLAYQGVGRGLGVNAVARLNEFATGGLAPDAVLLLELPVAEGLSRKGGAADRLEREGVAFLQRVAAGYEQLARERPEIIRIDSMGEIDEVGARIVEALAARHAETFAAVAGLRD